MKCRNIKENDNSAIFFGCSELKWPKKLIFDFYCDWWDMHKVRELEITNRDVNHTFYQSCQFQIAGDEEYPIYTDSFDIIFLGKDRDDVFTYWPKDVYSVFYVSSICSDGTSLNRVEISFVNDNDEIYYRINIPIADGETDEYESIAPVCKITTDNYVENADAIRCSLTQKLSVIKNELWYAYSFGLPLLDKSSSTIFDAYTAMIINNQVGVKQITKFKSEVDKSHYKLNFYASTIYGDINVETNR